MSSQGDVRIPKRAGSNVAFLGVELKDATIVICSVFLGLFCGSALDWGNIGYICMPVGGYFINRAYVDWQSRTLPGAVRKFFFSHGLAGYSPALDSQKTVYVGDSKVANLAATKQLDNLIAAAKRSQSGTERA